MQMRNRLAMIAAAVTVGLMVTGIAWAAQDTGSSDDDSTSTTAVTSTTGQTSTTGSTSTTATATANGSGTLVLSDGQVSQVQVADGGSVLLRRSGNSLTIISTQANAGWVVEVEVSTGREVEGDFRNGSRRVTFNFELEDGVIRVRIESEGATATTSTSTTNTTGTTGTTSGSALPVGTVTYNLDGAGTVTVVFANGQMSIGSINPAAGWTIEDSEQTGDEIELSLRNGEAEAELKLEIENGQVQIEIDSDSDGDNESDSES